MTKNHPLRIIGSIALGIVVYVLIIVVLTPLLSPPGMMGMMNPNYLTVNITSLLIGLLAGTAFYMITGPKSTEGMESIKKALSADEAAVIEQLEKETEITQDSLRFRLGWSKAKTSTVLTNLDKKGLIQRERLGKTYNVFLAKTV
ncbi:hypothetical protein HYU11_02675 [Candidatus Woesearchaeota archaeon]|nr:hypothetical protein [Candidatus Woesearchaeota archaeon]